MSNAYRPELRIISPEKGCACCGLRWAPKAVPEGLCPICDKAFVKRQPSQRYCSKQCRGEPGAGKKARKQLEEQGVRILPAILPAWSAGPMAVCGGCLARFSCWLRLLEVPIDRAEDFVFFTWLGHEAFSRQNGRVTSVCTRKRQKGIAKGQVATKRILKVS